MDAFKINTQSMLFGATAHIGNWSSIGKTNFNALCFISDLILLKLIHKVDFANLEDVNSILLKALFMVINWHGK